MEALVGDDPFEHPDQFAEAHEVVPSLVVGTAPSGRDEARCRAVPTVKEVEYVPRPIYRAGGLPLPRPLARLGRGWKL